MRNHLILISTTYPNLDIEPYLYYEFKHLLTAFHKITFISNTPLPDGTKLPNNCTFEFKSYLPNTLQKLKSLIYLFSPIFWIEFNIVLKTNRKDWLLNIKNLLGSIETAYRYKKTISDLIKGQKYQTKDTTVYSYWNNNVSIGLSILKKTYPDLKCISRAHGYDVYLERNSGNYLPLRRMIFSSLNNIFFVSNHGLLYTNNQFGKYKSCKVAYLGVEAIENVQNFEEKKTPSLKLISCSSLKHVKRVHLIIEALALSDIKIYWEHIGDGPLLSNLKKKASELLNKKSNIEYSFIGHLSNSEVLTYYSKSKFDIFLNVSESEGLPVSIMEAFCFGIPAIATDVGGTSEAVEDSVNGYLLPKDFSSNQLIDLIQEVSNQKSYLSTNAKLTWSSKFNASNNYPSFINKYLLR